MSVISSVWLTAIGGHAAKSALTVFEDTEVLDGNARIGAWNQKTVVTLCDPQLLAPAQPAVCTRAKHTATLLSDGKVLFIGNTTDTSSAELFDPASGL